MKHLVLVIAALLAAGFGITILVMTKASTIGILFSSVFVLFALVCMAPVQLQLLREQCAQAWAAYKNPPATKDGAP
jgi:hypothetical protein